MTEYGVLETRVAGASAECGLLRPILFAEHAHAEVQIAVGFRGANVRAVWHNGSGRNVSRSCQGSYTSVVPAGQPHTVHWRSQADLLLVFVHPTFLEHAVEAKFEVPEQYLQQDPLLTEVGSQIRYAFSEGAVTPLFFESAAVVLAARLALLAKGQIALSSAGAMPPLMLRRVQCFMEERLECSLSIAQLASFAQMSPDRFRRSFRLSAGTTPHQYLLARRVEKARTRILEGIPLVDVSTSLGFASQAHLSVAFKRAVGLTPGAYRKHHSTAVHFVQLPPVRERR